MVTIDPGCERCNDAVKGGPIMVQTNKEEVYVTER
jgi:hypothetical protein